MNWLDVMVVLVWIFYVWHSWGKGLAEVWVELLSWLAIQGLWFVGAVRLGHYLVRSLGLTNDWGMVVGMLVWAILGGAGMYLAGRLILAKVERQHTSFVWYSLLGLIPAMVSGGVLVMTVLMLLEVWPGVNLNQLYMDRSMFLGLARDGLWYLGIR